ncbi:MAG TPA: PQQ-dependent sugar dehydrogenase [Gemmatimonadaceae bacterium]|nr:PQQ-dependent sugar dehydrogenase [Gemmatimonadaceae bacterium]
MKALAAAIAFFACADSQAKSSAASPEQAAGTIRLEQIDGRFKNPVYLAAPPGDSRLFIVEQAGRIRIVKNGQALTEPFLDIADRVRSGGEQGLLSVAFHPDYRTNGFFYVNFTDRSGDTRVERFKVSANPDIADAASSKLVIGIDQPYANHNGGLVMFGPDGMLYIGMGDGGSGGDPHGNGQNRNALLGKILRLDVSSEPYGIPVGNPRTGGRAEIWATGMRNPWRFAFDRQANLLYVADVGQNEIEEIDVESATEAGLNYGWNIMEGDHCYRSSSCDREGLVMPKVTYNHSGGACSVTGGFVYRGRRIPSLAGQYFYSDYCAGWLKSFRMVNGAVTDRRDWKTSESLGHVVSFGEDASGELYILTEAGRVLLIVGV